MRRVIAVSALAFALPALATCSAPPEEEASPPRGESHLVIRTQEEGYGSFLEYSVTAHPDFDVGAYRLHLFVFTRANPTARDLVEGREARGGCSYWNVEAIRADWLGTMGPVQCSRDGEILPEADDKVLLWEEVTSMNAEVVEGDEEDHIRLSLSCEKSSSAPRDDATYFWHCYFDEPAADSTSSP